MMRLNSWAEVEAISWMGWNLFDFIMGCSLSAGWRSRCRELRHELLQISVTSLDADRLVHVLAQEFLHFWPLFDGQIHARIRAAPVGADGNQVAVLLVGRIDLSESIREIELLARTDLMHRTT